MRFACLLALVFVWFLLACQPMTSLPTVTIIDNDKIITLQTAEHVPSAILNQAEITLNPNDRILLNGISADLDQPITNYPITLQTRRAIPMTLVSTDGEHKLQSSALTVGRALQEAAVWLRAGDEVEPPLNSPISRSPVSISLARELTVTTNGKPIVINSSAQTVGEALAEAGIPLIQLDYSLPAENEPLPSDGQIRVVRVSETIQLAQRPIPFESELQ